MRSALLVLGTLLTLACGDDGTDAGAGADAGKPKDSCPQFGFTETGCSCDNGGVGSRFCGEDELWEPCECPEPLEPGTCRVGQMIQCQPCTGENMGRITECLDGGTFDCSCQTTRRSEDDGGA